ncbi:MAG: stage 0 sporulation protein [Candidatus Komeilibacteria bacterium CG_4_10_14_0_2_um_filter_37_10]|uniref:Stage 0 sporulation protein n=1 Tax=Candidatus Komeilibacteria bacterium CG_4_10_14_0_2_um_filter_37_10 TaxID=1974470 RepID=A0A2M7VGW1_9BACT|nr:MAG: stage 0 sporulation protein [Candidatus Komeilibacteria bacterium CG_4_10_14_0_2_um_filter_37_10]
MKAIELQFAHWDQIYLFLFPEKTDQTKLSIGDYLVVKTALGLDLGKVVGWREINEDNTVEDQQVKPYIRRATDDDLAQYQENNKDNESKLVQCQEMVKKTTLQMKLVDCLVSFDGSRIVLAFIADGRVDFRELVKELTKKFKKSIRMHQLGVRDEAKIVGDIGSCGRRICCRSHLKELGNVSTDYAKDQQVAHRGSERLSGLCGRLKCCLAYEEDFYQERLKKFPVVGKVVKTKDGQGVVIGVNVIKGTYDVRVEDDKKGSNIVKVEVK